MRYKQKKEKGRNRGAGENIQPRGGAGLEVKKMLGKGRPVPLKKKNPIKKGKKGGIWEDQ